MFLNLLDTGEAVEPRLQFLVQDGDGATWFALEHTVAMMQIDKNRPCYVGGPSVALRVTIARVKRIYDFVVVVVPLLLNMLWQTVVFHTHGEDTQVLALADGPLDGARPQERPIRVVRHRSLGAF